jgi:1-acyl-sn-glycerol-3-phosphate acyltransferase
MFISTIFFYPFLVISIILLKNYPLTFKIYRIWGKSICLFLGIIPILKGKENIPKANSFLMVANHTSQLDIIVPYALFKKHFAFLAKKELEKLPLFNINFKGMNVTVDRKSMISGVGSLQDCSRKLKQNINLLIFPEGTKNKNAPNLAKFKNGVFKLAIANNAPISPIVFHHNYKRFGADFVKQKASPGLSVTTVLPAIYPNDFIDSEDQLEALKKAAFDAMQKCIEDYKK